ncbi:hypothetical protein B5X24_HaOG215013 [Helicoverpa armigera]|uniref:Endonuclease/exonuclease/phosphatase domain-containing protein n=1 Tax=Helicoverpa armigera TaxID=29058 RepID=A0A2W1BBK2_HELAM|nr:hypothetical protein B5X24_HaOG215013 [Helicoverpa armigera]
MAKIAQLNLQGSALATTELPAVSKAMGVHIVLAQEPYCGSSAPSLTLPECSAPKVGIYVADRTTTCAVLQHLSTPHCLVCHILIGGLSMYMVSAYFQYSEDISPHLEHLARVLNTLRGCRVLVGADTNTHSPLWHSEQRHYIGRGGETTRRREAMEDFIMAHDLILHNVGNQPPTFATVNGESNIDVTLSTRGVRVDNWRVHEGASSSDHQLITFELGDPTRRRPSPTHARGQPSPGEPARFRDRGVDWEQFQCALQSRIGKLKWERPIVLVCEEFTRVIARTANDCLGTVGNRNERGYEWWNPALESMRRGYNRARKHWQKAKKRPGRMADDAREECCMLRSKYRKAMEEAQLEFFRKQAESGNQGPWGLAYRTASGRFRPPGNIINGTRLAEGFAENVDTAMRSLVGALSRQDLDKIITLVLSCASSYLGPRLSSPESERAILVEGVR